MKSLNDITLFYDDAPKKSNGGTLNDTLNCVILATEIYNSEKLAQFFHLPPDELVNKLTVSETAINKCWKFLKECKVKGFQTFINLIILNGITYSKQNFGKHVFVALKNENRSEFLMQLSNVEPKKKFTRDGECRMLDLFDGTPSYVTWSKQCNFEQLVKNKQVFVIAEPKSMQNDDEIQSLTKLECFLKANCLLDYLSNRFENNFNEGSVLKNIDITAKISLFKLVENSGNDIVQEVSTDYFEQLSELNLIFNDKTGPLDKMNIEKKFGKLLFVFIKYFQYCAKELEELKILFDEIHQKVKLFDYRLHCGLWCIISDGEKELQIAHPFIQMGTSRIEKFLTDIKEQTNALPPIVCLNTDEDSDMSFVTNDKKHPLKIVLFTPLKMEITNEQQNTNYFTGACQCFSDKKFLWLCPICQLVLLVNNEATILCGCGSYDKTDIKCSDICAKFEEDIHSESSSIDIVTKEDCSEHETLTENCQTVSKPVYTILVTGASGAGKSTFLNNIKSMKDHETFEMAKNAQEHTFLLPVKFYDYINNNQVTIEFDEIDNENENHTSMGQSVTQRPKNYVIDYGSYEVCYVDTPGTNDTRGPNQDEQNVKYIQDHLVTLNEVHGILFVVKNTESKLTSDFNNTMNMLLGLLPQKALQNCFFVYTFAASGGFLPGSVRNVMNNFLKPFTAKLSVSTVHLTSDNQFCVENDAFRQILVHHYYQDHNIDVYKSNWDRTKKNIQSILNNVVTKSPITKKDFIHVQRMNIIGQQLLQLGHQGQPTSPEMRQLMASVASTNMTKFAIYCHQNKGDAKPITSEMVPEVAAYWKNHDDVIYNALMEMYWDNQNQTETF